MWQSILGKFGLPVLRLVWAQVTPGLAEAIVAALRDLRTKAAATPNEWDDFAVGALIGLIEAVAGVKI